VCSSDLEVEGKESTDGWGLVLRLLRDRRRLQVEGLACREYASTVFELEKNMRRFEELMSAVQTGVPHVRRPAFSQSDLWKKVLKKILIYLRFR